VLLFKRERRTRRKHQARVDELHVRGSSGSPLQAPYATQTEATSFVPDQQVTKVTRTWILKPSGFCHNAKSHDGIRQLSGQHNGMSVKSIQTQKWAVWPGPVTRAGLKDM